MTEAPKLYVHKPKKAQLKQFKGMEGQSSSAAPPPPSSSSSSSSSSTTSKPPEVPKEPFLRRYRFLVPLVLGVNLAVGAYLFMRTKQKEVPTEDETNDAAPSTQAASAALPSSGVPPESPSAVVPIIAQPVAPAAPIPAHQQRELFKWMLEEKRKIKTNDPQEKKRIDEEKALLKQFIRAKSIPTI